MANQLAMTSLQVMHDEDPKVKLLAALGDKMDNVRPLWNQLSVAVYNRGGYDGKTEAMTKGGILLPKNATNEDNWQGKVGMIIAMGPGAFMDRDGKPFDDRPSVGDWVVYRVGDSLGSLCGKVMVRFLSDEAIRAVIDDPDSLY